MKSIGIKALKDNLSAYLKLVRQGETVLVTDRDEVIAEIRKPLNVAPSITGSPEALFKELQNRGLISQAQHSFSIRSRTDLPKRYGEIRLNELLDEMRSERN